MKRRPKTKVKIEDEGKKLPAKIVRDNEGTSTAVTVTRTRLNFQGAKGLEANDLVSHTRVMKIISITHKNDGSADVELEIIKRNWSKNY